MILKTPLMLAALAAAPAGERLMAATPTGFVSAFSAQQGQMTIEERIPRGETVEHWSRMITVQRFAGIAQLGSRHLLERIADGLKQACPDGAATPIGDSVIDGRTVSTMRADCPLNPQTGKPETFFAKVFTGATDLYSVQFAFRSTPGAADIAAAQAYLSSVALCPGAAKACSENR